MADAVAKGRQLAKRVGTGGGWSQDAGATSVARAAAAPQAFGVLESRGRSRWR